MEYTFFLSLHLFTEIDLKWCCVHVILIVVCCFLFFLLKLCRKVKVKQTIRTARMLLLSRCKSFKWKYGNFGEIFWREKIRFHFRNPPQRHRHHAFLSMLMNHYIEVYTRTK